MFCFSTETLMFWDKSIREKLSKKGFLNLNFDPLKSDHDPWEIVLKRLYFKIKRTTVPEQRLVDRIMEYWIEDLITSTICSLLSLVCKNFTPKSGKDK